MKTEERLFIMYEKDTDGKTDFSRKFYVSLSPNQIKKLRELVDKNEH